jgi:hypothetical protein
MEANQRQEAEESGEVSKTMSKASVLGLSLRGWFREVTSGEEARPILYAVEGLASSDERQDCVIGYAGIGPDGKKKWYIHWYKSGGVRKVLPEPYASPEEALEAVAEQIESDEEAAKR